MENETILRVLKDRLLRLVPKPGKYKRQFGEPPYRDIQRLLAAAEW
ncbi:MAG: hypothetical protein LBR96_00215 [Treponema sp.]|jgi:hypothetical protein|nr:hypothetical protein [Treponema sp.]